MLHAPSALIAHTCAQAQNLMTKFRANNNQVMMINLWLSFATEIAYSRRIFEAEVVRDIFAMLGESAAPSSSTSAEPPSSRLHFVAEIQALRASRSLPFAWSMVFVSCALWNRPKRCITSAPWAMRPDVNWKILKVRLMPYESIELVLSSARRKCSISAGFRCGAICSRWTNNVSSQIDHAGKRAQRPAQSKVWELFL